MKRYLGAYVREGEGKGAYCVCAVVDRVVTVAILFARHEVKAFLERHRACLSAFEVEAIVKLACRSEHRLPNGAEEPAVVVEGFAAATMWDHREWALDAFGGTSTVRPSDWESRPPRVTMFLRMSDGLRRGMLAPFDMIFGVKDAEGQYRAWVCYDKRTVRRLIGEQRAAAGTSEAVWNRQLDRSWLPETDGSLVPIELGRTAASRLAAEDLSALVELRAHQQTMVTDEMVRLAGPVVH
jgi:hypothetical protein